MTKCLKIDPGNGNEVLLIVGGFDGSQILSSAEVYSPSGGCNFQIAPLPQPAYELFAVYFRGYVFACGGDVGKQCWRLVVEFGWPLGFPYK